MNILLSNTLKGIWRTVLVCAAMACTLTAMAQTPSPFAQTPLLSKASSVKPNLMLLLDNSGSMDDDQAPNSLTPHFANPMTNANAVISPDINQIYYDPRTRYQPRPNADGTLQAAGTEATAGAIGNRSSLTNVALPFNICTAVDATGACTGFAAYSIPAPANSTTFVTSTYVVKTADRTDCITLPTRCTWAEERQNALNWQLYYSTKIEATKTSIGIAFLDSKFDNKFRLGYQKMNSQSDNGVSIDRGVRPFTNDTSLPVGFRTEKTDFYTWLYAQIANNSTPANTLLQFAGDYYLDNTNTGPWAARPILGGDSSPHLSCRRSNAVLFSDGEYNDTPPTSGNVDNGSFGSVSNTTHVNPVNTVTFAYSKTASKTATYIAYPDGNADTMADLAASYWIRDLRPDLADNVTPVDGNPAFWQHMTTYTIGMGVEGSVTPVQIAQYNIDFSNGMTTATLAWGDPTANATNKINDFIHAAYSGRGRFYSANSTGDVKKAFNDVIARTIQQAGSNAGVAVSDTNSSLATLAGELKYVPSFSLLESTGDIQAFTLSQNGNVSGTSPAWLASRNIPSSSSRTLVTSTAIGTTVGYNLTTPFASLPTDVKTALGSNANDSFINYLRGDTTGTNVAGQSLRIRNSRMGTVVNSPPTYVRGELDMGYTSTFVASSFTGISSYAAYTKAKRENGLGVLFAAANDGIVHAINAKTGAEIMGFMPRSAMPKLDAFSQEPYNHQYILDGPISEGDIYNGAQSQWKSMVFGTGGRGGQYVYALNVPVQATPASPLLAPTMSKSDVRWEINNTMTNFSNLGYVLNAPQTGYLPDGTWVAVFGNGYYSATGVASLFIVNALTGARIQEISTGQGSTSATNGMGGITLVRGASRQIVAAIGGDSNGNMWKFDLTAATSTGGGKVAFGGQPLFTEPNNQPFSGAPAWRPLNGGMLVVAATGLLNTAADASSTSVQTIYGVLDKTAVGGAETTTFTVPVSMATLQLQTTSLVVSSSTAVASFYKVSTNSVNYSTQGGWKLEMTFEAGQRSIADVLNLGQTVVISTVVPPSNASTVETCTADNSVAGFVYQLDAETGGNPDNAGHKGGNGSGFDVNGDGVGDGMGVAKSLGFPRGNVIARDTFGPRTESLVGGENAPCDGSSASGSLLGTGDKALSLISTCTSTAWKRTWRQLLNPPRIN
jgi:type IV pilus assembly protein PilY1